MAISTSALAADGESLFDGGAPLSAHVDGQREALPAEVVACVNCHGGDADAAPALGGGWLGQLRSRRNGPVAAYDETTFCTALRTGTDPVQIRLPSRMPRFDLSDQECEALWNYLDSPASIRP